MKVVVTGATGMIGSAVVRALRERGDRVRALVREEERGRSELGDETEAIEWPDPAGGPPPPGALDGCDAAINLMGAPIAQRWTRKAKREIRDSRVLGTRNLVAGLGSADPRPRVLVSQSASGYYGARGDERLDETVPSGDDFLAGVVVEWEHEALGAEALGLRVARPRTGVVLSQSGGALGKMLPPFKLGIGGPVAGGRQYVPWIHLDDVVAGLVFLIDTDAASGPVNLTAPEPVTNKELSKALGRVLRRPAVTPVPALALRVLYGEMAQVVTTGARLVPRRLEQLGFSWQEPDIEPALRKATGRG
jgi:uncharacterized protein (TIGR01777 family)